MSAYQEKRPIHWWRGLLALYLAFFLMVIIFRSDTSFFWYLHPQFKWLDLLASTLALISLWCGLVWLRLVRHGLMIALAVCFAVYQFVVWHFTRQTVIDQYPLPDNQFLELEHMGFGAIGDDFILVYQVRHYWLIATRTHIKTFKKKLSGDILHVEIDESVCTIHLWLTDYSAKQSSHILRLENCAHR